MLNTKAIERANAKLTAEAVPMMEREVAALGRSVSVRTAKINHFGSQPETPPEAVSPPAPALGAQARK
jgi:hypothetical protein